MVDLSKLSEGLTIDEVRRSLLALTYHDVLDRVRPMYTDIDLAAMSEDDLRVAYFTEFYVDEYGGA